MRTSQIIILLLVIGILISIAAILGMPKKELLLMLIFAPVLVSGLILYKKLNPENFSDDDFFTE